MNSTFDKTWWETTWLHRMGSVESCFGPADPPGIVTSFNFPDPRYTVPGACAVRFRNLTRRGNGLTISMGLSQPLNANEKGHAWELGVYSNPEETWPAELIYDLVLGFAKHPGWLDEGHCLPLTFFRDHLGKLDCGSFSADSDERIRPVGELRSLYLWHDMDLRRTVETELGSFYLMIATGITADEEEAGDETSPPHVMLLLRELGIGQKTDPMRRSVFDMPNGMSNWNRIRQLTHSEVLRRLASQE